MLHDLLFNQAVAAVPRPLGAEVGFVGVLHSWGRQLQHHPHIHFMVPGGRLRADHRKWRRTRQPDWLLPGEALAGAMRRGFDEASPRFSPAFSAGLPGDTSVMVTPFVSAGSLRAAAPEVHAQVPDSCWRDGWWVHTQPAGSGQAVVRYLARYVGKTAISDERVLAADDHAVRFAFTDTANGERLARGEFDSSRGAKRSTRPRKGYANAF